MATEQQLNTLSEYDFIVVVDASGSMGTEDMKGRSRWKTVRDMVKEGLDALN